MYVKGISFNANRTFPRNKLQGITTDLRLTVWLIELTGQTNMAYHVTYHAER